MKVKKKSSVRDLWIPESWRYNGSGFYTNKKRLIPRKKKYKSEYKCNCIKIELI